MTAQGVLFHQTNSSGRVIKELVEVNIKMQHTYIDLPFQVIDDDKFRFLTTPTICMESPPFMIVIILSMVVNVEQRSAIRRSILLHNQNINESGNHALQKHGTIAPQTS